ncbi:uncharacterized protein LOC144911398 [Branchiostoma floridae x Branchiostoma belcheri]
MSSKKLFPNDKTGPEVSVGHYGNRWTNGIVLTLSGLAAVGFVALLFMVREIASMREQQTAFMRETRDQQTVFMRETRDQQTVFMRETRDQQTAFMRETRDQQTVFQKDLQGLKDQVLLMKQQNEAKDTGPSSSTEDWQRDDSATFWKSAEVHHRSKRNSEAKTVLILGKRSDFGCLSGPSVKGFTVWVQSCAYEDPGFGRCTYISSNGQVSQIENEILRGHLVFILNEQTGEVLDKAVFDTWGGYGGGGRAAAQRLTTYLQGVKEERIIAIAVHDTSNTYVDLTPYGSTLTYGNRESFAMITQKGRTPTWFVEKKSPRGAGPTVVEAYIQVADEN